ncbi:MAG TPA: hypothetical protein VK485_10625 [Sphingomicrobium sp.]|nr:hypothetical protein [Sphingomicrobium sp.]
MSFAYDRDRKAIMDPDTGDVLKQERPHYQELRWYQTIFGPDGTKKFAATVMTDADGSRANPKKPGDHVLVSAVRYDAEGRTSEASGRDPDLRRIIEYIRTQVDPAKPFTFSDARNGMRPLIGVGVDYRFTLALGLAGVTVAWMLLR